jgi:hypothetical protein
MTRKPGLNRLRLLTIAVVTIGATAGAEAQLQSPETQVKQPTIHDTKVRPRNDQTDGGSSSSSSIGKSLPTPDVKRIRTTRERATEGSAPPAVSPLIPPPGQQ